MNRSQPLAIYLAHCTWHHALALLAAHHLPRDAKQTKAALIDMLTQHLLQPATIATSIAQLDAVGKDALRALVAAGGALPVHPFHQRFGPLRPYRPWRKDPSADGQPPLVQPWLAPISTTETLWYLGLLFRDPPKPQPGRVQHYVLPADLILHLTARLRQPVTTVSLMTVPRSQPFSLKK